MNKRLVELVQEHGFIHEFMTVGERNDALTKIEAITKLIVRECSAIANFHSDGHEVYQFDDSKRYLYFVDIGKTILDVFEVEE
jgi:ribosomal protein S8